MSGISNVSGIVTSGVSTAAAAVVTRDYAAEAQALASPNIFDAAAYLQAPGNGDIGPGAASHGLTPLEFAAKHYVEWGQSEGRALSKAPLASDATAFASGMSSNLSLSASSNPAAMTFGATAADIAIDAKIATADAAVQNAISKGQDPLAAREDYITALQEGLSHYQTFDSNQAKAIMTKIVDQGTQFIDRLSQSAGSALADRSLLVSSLLDGHSTEEVWVKVVSNNSTNPDVIAVETAMRGVARDTLNMGGDNASMRLFAQYTQLADAVYAKVEPGNPRAAQVQQGVADCKAAGLYSSNGTTGTNPIVGASNGLYSTMTPAQTTLTWTTAMGQDAYGKPIVIQIPSVASDTRDPGLLQAIQDYGKAVSSGPLERRTFSGLSNGAQIYGLNMPDQMVPLMAQAYLGRAATADELSLWKSMGPVATQEIQKVGDAAYLSQFPNLNPADAPAKLNAYHDYVASLLYWTPVDANQTRIADSNTALGSTTSSTISGAAVLASAIKNPAPSTPDFPVQLPPGGLYTSMDGSYTQGLVGAIQDYGNACDKSTTAMIFSGKGNPGGPIHGLNMPDQMVPLLAEAFLGRAATPEELAHYKSMPPFTCNQALHDQGVKAYLSQFPTLAAAEIPAKIETYNKYVASLLHW